MSVFNDMFKSKKFWYAVVSGIVAIVGHLKPDWSGVVQNVLYGLVALILGQGLSDVGKAAAAIKGS